MRPLTTTIAILALSVGAVYGQEITPGGVVAVRIDGTTVTGEWIGSADGSALALQVGAERLSIPFDDLSTVTFTRATPKSAEGSAVFHLVDGGRLVGELLGGEADSVVARTSLGDSCGLRFDRLAGVRLADGDDFQRADRLFQSALAERLPGKDVLITRDVEEVRTVRGRLEVLDTERGSFALGSRLRTFLTERIFGVVFASGVEGDETHQVTVELVDGSVFSGRVAHADRAAARFATSLGFEAGVPLADLLVMRVHSDRLVYLSDLAPASERGEGRLHPAWPMRRDRSVADRPISIGGRPFEKGLGVHSRTELVYEINGEYGSFAATIGIDDAVRPRGSVVFRVLGDGRELYDSGLVTGTEEARDIIVDLTGVGRLTLLVDYGDGLDLADQADWGGARLLKPPSDQ
jgi:hypothetical protein